MVKKIKKKKLVSKRKKAIKEKIKSLRKDLNSLQEDWNSLPESCSYCNSKFDLKKDAFTWMVHFYEGQPPILICPTCFKERNQ